MTAGTETLETEVLDGLDAVRADVWDRLLPWPGAGLSHDYLTTWEHVELPGLRSRPLVARRRATREIAAAVPGYFYELDVAGMASDRVARIIAAARRLWRRLLVVRIFEVGCPTALASPLLHDPAVPAGVATRAVMRAAVAEATRGRAHIVVAEDFAEGPRAVGEALSELGFVPLPIMPTVWLDLPFESFDEYVHAMRSQYRRRVRKAFQRSASLRVERRREFSELVPEFTRLSHQMFERAKEVKRERSGEAFFARASACEPISALVLRREDGSISSFALLLDDGPCLRFLHCGFELDAGKRESAYFRLLYEIVRTAIDDGFRRVDFGVTTLAPKLDTGGVPVPLVAWVRHPNPLVRSVFRVITRRLFSSSTAEPRKVFKKPMPTPLPIRERPSDLREPARAA